MRLLVKNPNPRWPFLWELVQKEYLLFFDYFFAESIHPDGSESEAALLTLLMASSRRGHICIQSDAFAVSSFIKDLLQASKMEMLANEGAATLNIKEVCREGSRFYLQKNWLYEKAVAEHVKRLLNQNPKENISIDFQSSCTEEQKTAIEKAVRHPLSIITGGPGTGKSFTAMQIVSAFLKKGANSIILCAPTGKAVQHLAAKCSFANVESNTLHSILKVHKDVEQLIADLVIVDECSMMDAALFARLFSSIKEGTHLVLMGDPDQLPAVEGGSFFADLIEACKKDLPLQCTRLTKCLRSEESKILNLSAAIKEKRWNLPEKNLNEEEIWKEVEKFFPYPSESPPNVSEILQKMNEFRILSTIRKGNFGVDDLNERIAERILSNRSANQYCCIPIIIGRNDERTALFNGETGILVKTPNPDEEYAYFDGNRTFLAALLPFYEYAYCLSVHKSQGSEYEHVLLLIPEGSDYFGMELLYTAVTRAKKSIQIRGSNALIRSILSRSSLKMSGLTLLSC